MKIIKPLFLILLAAAPVFAEDLSMTRGVELALDNNLYMRLAKAAGDARKAEALIAASRLLPQVDFSISQTRTFKENATAMGFGYAAGGGVFLLGPFNTFDARLRLVQTVLDLSARNTARSRSEEERSARLRVSLAAEQVSAAAALAYLEVLRSSAAVNSAASGLEVAVSLRSLAEGKHDAGTATGLDVLRARTREAEESLRVSRARTALAEALLRLKHLLGLPFSKELTLTETLAFIAPGIPGEREASARALAGRLELEMARADLSAGSYALKAARSARVPAIAVSGDAAMSGNNPDHEAKLVGDIGVALKVPLLAGGRVSAGIDAAAAAKQRAQSLLDDAAAQVEEETLTALYRLRASAQEVATASMTVTMTAQQLEMTRNRFSAGVGDNVELVDAQTSLSRARDSFIDALSRSKEAGIRLALALGTMKAFKF
jgi:outer membrane protein TolC